MKIESANLFVNFTIPQITIGDLTVDVSYQAILGEEGCKSGGPFIEIELIDYVNVVFGKEKVGDDYKKFKEIRDFYSSMGRDICEEIDDIARQNFDEYTIENHFLGVRNYLK